MSTPATTPRPNPDVIADPGPLGLTAFASTTFVLSCFNAGRIDGDLLPVVLPLALFFGGLMQVLAGVAGPVADHFGAECGEEAVGADLRVGRAGQLQKVGAVAAPEVVYAGT